jgi:hypothetical protein
MKVISWTLLKKDEGVFGVSHSPISTQLDLAPLVAC